MKSILSFTFFICLLLGSCTAASQQPPRQKVVDEGGLGKYSAIVTEDAHFPGYTIYRPADLKKAASKVSVPLLLFGNGGCSNTSIYFERFLNEIASFGYVVIAIGPYQESEETAKQDENSSQWTDYELLLKAIDLMDEAVADEKSVFYQAVDMDKIGVMGQSCGGLQALAVSSNPRIDATICLNSGVITPTSEQSARIKNYVVQKSVLEQLHAPILYLVGGKEDIAYPNALDDYERIDNVFAVIATDNSGHMGTYGEEFGGTYGQLALRWFEWLLHGEEWAQSIFVGEECICAYPGWDAMFKNTEKLTLP